MRITDIEIKNFRAFYGEHHIKLDNAGKNLMVYGENGSGKSSLFHALKMFFEASVAEIPFSGEENIFIAQGQQGTGFIKIKVKETPGANASIQYELTPQANKLNGADTIHIADANKIKAFFDYKSLLKTHFIDLHEDKVNLFDILVDGILYHSINQFTTEELGKGWNEIFHEAHNVRQGTHVVRWIKESLEKFNDGLKVLLSDIEQNTNTYLEIFGVNVRVSFDFNGVEYHGRRSLRRQELLLRIDFCGKPVQKHQYFLNEARLSALAISLYLASIKVHPMEGTLKLLVLDDLLIGLDMSNRVPLLKILKDHFEDDFQIIMTTYDKIWYEVVRNHFDQQSWKYIEIYSKKLKEVDFEIPVINDHTAFLDRARHYLNERDYKASAVYIRTEFERLVKKCCEKKRLSVLYKKNPKDMQSNDFWESIKAQTNISDAMKADIELHRGTVMNPFSHYDLERPEFRPELENTINAVESFGNAINTIQKLAT